MENTPVVRRVDLHFRQRDGEPRLDWNAKRTESPYVVSVQRPEGSSLSSPVSEEKTGEPSIYGTLFQTRLVALWRTPL